MYSCQGVFRFCGMFDFHLSVSGLCVQLLCLMHMVVTGMGVKGFIS